MPDCFINECVLGEGVGCEEFVELALAQKVCSANPRCSGLTEGGGVFSTRSGIIVNGKPVYGVSDVGERCFVKLRGPTCA